MDKQIKDTMIGIRVTPSERDLWHTHAKESGTTLSKLFRKYIERRMKKESAK